MKRFIFLLLFFLGFLIFSPSKAYACDPSKGDWVDCKIAPYGPKIAGDIQIENYEKIAEEYRKANPEYANMIIPTTIIYTGSDFKGDIANSDDPAYHTLGNLEAMYANGLSPVVRTWGNMEGEEAIQAGRTLNALSTALQQKYGVTTPFTVYFGNEPNLESEGFHNDPARYAASFNNLLKGADFNPNFPLYMPPIAGHQSTTGLINEQNFAAQILNSTMSDGSKLYQNLNGAFLTIYQPDAQSAIADMKSWWNFYSGFGINKIAISEIGPFSNGHLLQNPGDIAEWQKIMSEMFAYFKAHPDELDFDGDGIIDIEFMNTSFFRDTDGDGFPDITDLVIIDQFGNAVVDANALLLGGGFGWPATQPNLSCASQDQGPFRPRAYSTSCKVQEVPKPVKAKATTFNVITKISKSIFDVVGSQECGGNYFVKHSWSADIGEDYSETRLPWAGYGKSADVDQAESKYLADYLDGTIYADTLAPNLPVDWPTVGVFKKLSVGWYQDELKTELIKNSPENYTVELDGTKQYLTAIIPPPGDDPITSLTWKLWKITKKRDFNVWPAVPMFTRQDSPATVQITAQNPPATMTSSSDGHRQDAANKITFALSSPHVKRTLDIATTFLQNISPAGTKEFLPDEDKNKPLVSDSSIIQNKDLTLKDKFTKTISLITNSAKSIITSLKQKIPALAQTNTPPGTNNCEEGESGGMHMIVNEENGGIQVHAWNTQPPECGDPSDYSFAITYYWDGVRIGGCGDQDTDGDGKIDGVYKGGGGYLPRYNPNGTGEEKYGLWINGMNNGKPNDCKIPIEPTANWQDHFSLNYQVINSHGSEIPGCSKSPKCTVGKIPPTTPTPTPAPQCNFKGSTVGTVTIKGELDPKDPDQLDNFRPAAIVQHLEMPEDYSPYPVNKAQTKLIQCNDCLGSLAPGEGKGKCDGYCKVTLTYSTEISSKLEFPYNEEVANRFAKDNSEGFLNNFIPNNNKGFDKDDAKSKITHTSYTANVTVDPEQGEVESGLYLKGAYDAQACVSQRLLLPSFAGQPVECPNLF
jgi:hypothetical protein